MKGNFDNSGKFVKLTLMRERVMSPVWIVFLTAFSVSLAPVMEGMFSQSARQALAETLKNPAMTAMMGPVYGADNYTAGAMYSNMMLLWLLITVAVMNIFFTVRHTRADEETGRAEVTRSLPSGRLASLNAAMISACAVNAVLGLLIGFCLAAAGVSGMDFAGSMLFGAAIFISGLFFAALTAMFCQLSASSRGALALSFISMALFYLIRAAGDMKSETLSLISPLGLILRSRIFVENDPLPCLILLSEAAVLTAIAYALSGIRDMGHGFIPAKPGRRNAKKILNSAFGLSFTLMKNTLIAWFLTMFALGASYGSILGDIDTFIGESDTYRMILGISSGSAYSAAEMFATFVNSMMALVCLVPLLLAVLKVRSEERDGHAEHILSKTVSRREYLSGYAALAFAASVLFQCATALGLYCAAALIPEKLGISLGFLLKANLVYLPGLWVMIGASVLTVGLAPRAVNAIWGYYGFTAFISFIGRTLDLPEWIVNLSPLSYIPQLPMEEINFAPLAALTVIAAGLTAAGFIFYGKRDTAA